MQFKIVKNRERETGKLPLHLPLQPHLLPHNFSFFSTHSTSFHSSRLFHSRHLCRHIFSRICCCRFRFRFRFPVSDVWLSDFPSSFHHGFSAFVQWFSFFFFSNWFSFPFMLCESTTWPLKPFYHWLWLLLRWLLKRLQTLFYAVTCLDRLVKA